MATAAPLLHSCRLGRRQASPCRSLLLSQGRSPSTFSLSTSSYHSDVSLRFLTARRGFSLRSQSRKPLSVVAMAPPKPGGKAKKVALVGLIKLALEARKATPAPPVGPALGSKGVNIMEFCKTAMPRPPIKPDKSFTFILKTPPASVLLLNAAGVEKGSKDPKTQKVGKITVEQLRAIAAEKLQDRNCTTIESAMRIIAGTVMRGLK